MDNYEILTSISSEGQLNNIITGGLLLGCGGGGGKDDGIAIKAKILEAIASSQSKKIPVVRNNDTTLNSGSVSAMMGSPDALTHDNDFTAPSRSYTSLKQYLNENFNFVCAIEIGAVNSLIPILTAAQLQNISVVDGDGAKRAVPQLQLTTYGILQADQQPLIPISPTSVSNDNISSDMNYNVDVIIGNKEIKNKNANNNYSDAEIVEIIARSILSTPVFENICGISFYPFENKIVNKLEQATTKNSLSITQQIGKNLNELSKKNILEYIYKMYSNSEIRTKYFTNLFPTMDLIKVFYGKFEKFTPVQSSNRIKNVKSSGFDYGTITLKNYNKTLQPNKEFNIYFENENLLAAEYDGINYSTWAMGPDMICYITNNGPLSNIEIVNLQVGEPVLILGFKCDPKMRNDYISSGFYEVISSITTEKQGGFIPPQAVPKKYIPIENL